MLGVLAFNGKEELLEQDEMVIALRAVEPILSARLDRILRELVSGFKQGKLTQELVQRLKAEHDAARGLLGVINEAAGGKQNG